MDIWAEIKTGEHWTDDQGAIHEEVNQKRLIKVSLLNEITEGAKEQLVYMINKELQNLT